jgi:hypothetical protein
MEKVGYWMGCGKGETERGFNGYWRHGCGDYGIRFSSCDERFVEKKILLGRNDDVRDIAVIKSALNSRETWDPF